jgi:hypothetical protein
MHHGKCEMWERNINWEGGKKGKINK